MMLAFKTNFERSPNPNLNKRAELEPGQLPRLVVGTLGYPGSGKSTFGHQLADRTGGYCLDGDVIKRDIEKQAAIKDNKNRWQNRYDVLTLVDLKGDLRQAAINSGRLVIGADQHNELARRRKIANWAKSFGYQFVIAWIRTPKEVAIERLIERDESVAGFLPTDRKHASERIDRILKSFDPPAQDESWVEIDGCADFASQYQTFENFWSQLSDSSDDPKNR